MSQMRAMVLRRGRLSIEAVDPSPMLTATVSLEQLPAEFESLGKPDDCLVTLIFP